MKYLEELTKKEMSRKEFLTLVGTGIVSIFGFTAVFRAMLDRQHRTHGYGSNIYGGRKH